jgi:hypothetical protein
MSGPSNWPRNRLLLALPSSDLQQIMPELEHIRCEREQVLMDADSPLDHVFCSDTGVVSVVAVYFGRQPGASKIAQDITERKQADDLRALMADE